MDSMSLECNSPFASASALAGAKGDARLERCISPMSQASTAPPTPAGLGALPRALFARSTSAQSEDSGCSGRGSEEAYLDDIMQLLAPMEDWDKTLEAEYLVDNSKLKAATIGLAYRHSKRVQDRDHSVPGPCWGTTVVGIDQGDGWLKAGNHFLPMELGGVSVLAAQGMAEFREEALWDGPALTASGRAVDLEDGSVLFFTHSKELSLGYEMAHHAKEEVRLLRSVRLAHAACEAEARLEAGEACSLDAQGVVRGALARSAAAEASGDARRRLARRRASGAERRRGEGRPILCADACGKVSLYLPLRAPSARTELLRRKLASEDCGTSGVLLVASPDGRIQGWRSFHKCPEVIPAPWTAEAQA